MSGTSEPPKRIVLTLLSSLAFDTVSAGASRFMLHSST